MRKLVVTENITLDGVIDAREGWFAPSGEDGGVDESDIVVELRRQMRSEDALLLGRRTFESFRGYWPAQADDETGITKHLNEVKKYVLSGTIDDPRWANTTVLRGPLEDAVATLKGETGGDVGVTGSISVVHALIAAGLVDEYRLFVYPVVLGRGARLFRDATEVPKLTLLACRPFESGVVLLRYAAADSSSVTVEA